MDTKDYIKLFEQSSELLVVIDTNFAIVAASDAFLKTTATVRENIVGRDIFKVFPDNPEDKTANGQRIARASFNRVIKNKIKDVLTVVKYDIPKPESEGGGYELKYWQATNSPVLDDNNNVKYIIHRTEDVTENKTLITQHEVDIKALKLIEDSEKRYNMMLMKSPFAFAVIKGKNMVITLANDSVKEMWGKGKDLEGKPLLEVLPEIKDCEFPGLLDKVYTTGTPFYGEELLAPVFRNGKLEDVYFNFVYQPYLEADETISGVTIIAAEVTAAVIVKKALEAQHEAEKKALKLVEETNKRYYTMLMESPFAFCVMKGKDMTVALANDLTKELWGKGMDVEGKTLLEVLPEMKNQPFPAMLDKVFTTGIPFYFNETLARLQHKDKMEERYFNIVYQPDHDADGTISGVIQIAYDVTETVLARKKIEESDKRYNMMLMKSPFAFAVIKGKNMVITLANDSVKEMWGKGKDLEGKSLLEVLPEINDFEFPDLLDKVYTTGTPFYGEELLAPVFRNGKLEDVYFNFVYQPYLEADETISGVTIIAYEVTEQVIAKQKIKDSQQQLQNIFMQAPFSLNIYEGKELVISLANKLFCEIIGKTESEILGKKLFDVFPETAQRLDKILSDIFSTGIPFRANEFPVHFLKHGNEFNGYFDFIYQPIFDYNKNVSGVVNVAIDVTDKVLARKKIEESEAHFRQLADLMPAKISNADPAGNVTYFNKHWLDYTGYSFEELRDFGYHKIMHPDELDEFQKRLQIAGENGTVLEMEMRFMNKKGDYRWHLNLASPIKDENGHIKMWVGSTTDIHELKEAKNKAEVATQIAENAVKAKQQFLSNMSHEIRTPMNAIIGFTNVVLKTQLNKEQKKYINAIKVSGDALIVLINDILDIAKVDAGKMTFEQIPFELSDSISATLQLFEPKIQEKNLKLIEKYDDAIPEILLGDPLRLRQIILNLLSNAVKFTDKGKITVSVRLLKEEADSIAIEFSVTDTGIGIPENKLEHIFGDFQQATDDTSRFHGGTGLGLSIVKQFVELQGGTLLVKSKPGKGSTFSFILNFKKAIAATTERAEITGTDNGVELAGRIENIRVLVAEDMPLNQLLIKIILEDFGFQVDIAGNGKIAIEKLQENKYDIILMDLQMPVLNGFEATEHIRSKMNSQIPIIALTADVTTVDVGKCEAVGMNDYISKPIDEKLLYSKIIKYLKKAN